MDDPGGYRKTFHANMQTILAKQFGGTVSAFAQKVEASDKSIKRWCAIGPEEPAVPGLADAVRISMKTGWSLSRLVGLSSTAEDDVQTTLAAAYHEITQMEDALERLLADLRAARRVRSESQVEAAIAKIVPPAPGGGTGSEHAS